MISSITTWTLDTRCLARLRLVGSLSTLHAARRRAGSGELTRSTHSLTVVLRLGACVSVSGLSLWTCCTTLTSSHVLERQCVKCVLYYVHCDQMSSNARAELYLTVHTEKLSTMKKV